MRAIILGERGRACTPDLYCYQIQIVTTFFRNICVFCSPKGYQSSYTKSIFKCRLAHTMVKLDRV
jgi:hypothetical protein